MNVKEFLQRENLADLRKTYVEYSRRAVTIGSAGAVGGAIFRFDSSQLIRFA